MADFKFTEIPADKVEKQARGRKPSENTTKMAEAFKTPKAGVAVVLNGLTAKDKTEKASLSATIRQAAKLANRDVRIDYRTDGTPQVTFKR